MKTPDKYRIDTSQKAYKWGVQPRLISTNEYGNDGFFIIPRVVRNKKVDIAAMSSDGSGWDHVSVSIIGSKRCPSWNEMAFIKNLFWDPEDCVIQYHPPEAQYINCHPYTLHLWKVQRWVGEGIPIPPMELVGPNTHK